MKKTKSNFFSRSISLFMALVMCVGMLAAAAFAAEASPNTSEKYVVPIKSLTSAAPLPAVQTAFAGAFGDSVTVNVNSDGSKTATINNYHMVIDLMGNKYDANVVSIADADMTLDGVQSATILSTKEEVYTKGMGGPQESITVPEKFEIPLNLDSDNSQKISITVDFMDAFLGGGNPYPTTVTLTLDMDAAKPDTAELEALIAECQSIPAENYTSESYSNLTAAIAKAEKVVSAPESMESLNAMIEELNLAKNSLEYKGADYSAVDAALAKIPSDRSVYTEESWKAVENARNAVINGLDMNQQETVDGFAADIEAAIAQLEKKPIDTPTEPEKPSEPVNPAKPTNPADEKIDINNLTDGIYEIPVALWHASQDKASMAAESFNGTARIVVKDGNITVYVYTKPMTFGSITASLQEMKIQQADGSWVNADIQQKSSDGNPVCFSFPLDRLSEYITVKVNPHVEMMGNQDLDARLKFDLASIKLLPETDEKDILIPPAETNKSDNTNSSVKKNSNAKSPKTGNDFNLAAGAAVMIAGAGALTAVMISKKRRTAFNR